MARSKCSSDGTTFTDLVYIPNMNWPTSSALSVDGIQRVRRTSLSQRLNVQSSTALLVLFAGARGIKLPHGRHFGRRSGCLCLGDLTTCMISSDIANHGLVRSSTSSSLRLCRRFWQELFEVFEQIRGSVKKLCDLSINVLDRFRLSFVGLQDVKKLLVRLGLLDKAILQRGMVS